MKKIEIDTFLKFQFLCNPQFSPDGTKIAFTVSVPDLGSNGYLADLYLYDLETKSVSRITAGGDAKTWSWTPDNTCSFPQPAPTLKKGIRRTESLIFTRSPRPAVRPCAARPFRPSSQGSIFFPTGVIS